MYPGRDIQGQEKHYQTWPAKELLSGIAKKIFTMGAPTKLTRVFPEAAHKLTMCPGLFWCLFSWWIIQTVAFWFILFSLNVNTIMRN